MSEPLQLVLTAKQKNADLVETLKNASTDVESQEPGTLDWRAFREEDGTFRFFDIYASSEAFLEHFGRAKESGFLDDFMNGVEFTEVLVMGRPTAEARGVLDQLGARYAEPASGFSRLV